MYFKILFLFLSSVFTNISINYHKIVKKLNHKNHHLNVSKHSQSYELSLSQNKDKNLYYITLLISDKKIPVDFMIDTGSSLLWMPKTKCLDNTKHQICGKFIQQNDYGYLDGQISGDMIVTNIYLNKNVVNKNAVMMLTTYQEKNVQDPIIGLSYSRNIFPTFLEKMKQNNLIEKSAFTIDMQNQKLIFGIINKDRQTVQANFSGMGEFIIQVQSLKFNEDQLFIKSFSGLVDSGNTLISLPYIFQQSLLDILQIDCKTKVEDNPSFTQLYCKENQSQNIGALRINISDHEFILTNEDLLESCDIDDNDDKNKEFEGYCAMSIEFHRDFSQSVVILGDPFLRKFMATFNLDDEVIEFDITPKRIKEIETL